MRVLVPPGGSVQTRAGDFTCRAGADCILEVHDIHFDRTFVAVPAPGWRFVGWDAPRRALCGHRNGHCHLRTSGFAGDPMLMDILESDQEFYLVPRFERREAGCGP